MRLERARQGVEEAQRLRDAFQLDLERHSNVGSPNDGTENGLERVNVLALQTQIEQMSTTIIGLQAEVQRQVEENLPPDYSVVVVSPRISLVRSPPCI